ncbi:uroporphyrinogen-III synthase [Saprospiraceae bacterium]|jgi:uroporphyrinogen-III synthase|nr:uroporphyrinogen-III synthase [Saprospiraceae bacterium]
MLNEKKKSVFITRDLEPDSIFLTALQHAGFDVFGKSLIEFETISFEKFPKTDWIFFYSQNAVRFFEKGLSKKDKTAIFEHTCLGTIGESTANLTKLLFKKCDFTGNGDPKTTAEAFLKIAKDKRVLFPHAENSRQSIQKLLSGEIYDFDLVVYKNHPRKDLSLPDFEVLVFTSPMNVDAYLSKKKFLKNQTIISIGQTTAQALKEYGINNIITSRKPSELNLANAVKNAF